MANVYFGLLTQFKTLWEKEYPGQKFYPQKYHYKQLKERMASAEGFEPIPPEEVVKRMRVYLRTDYWKICKHNFSKFVEYFTPEFNREKTEKVKQYILAKLAIKEYVVLDDAITELRESRTLVNKGFYDMQREGKGKLKYIKEVGLVIQTAK